ncbi:MAG: nephrocystin-3 [Dokdonia sp.]|jgi:nephrocystin-3
MGILSSLAIKTGITIGIEIYKKYTNDVDKQIQDTFKATLKAWAKNKDVRDRNEPRLLTALKNYGDNTSVIVREDVPKEIAVFLDLFEKKLATNQAAYNYLKSIQTKNNHKEVLDKISESQIDPRDIGDWLNKLPFDRGEEAVKEAIEQLYSQRNIEEKEKALLKLATKKIFERTNELSQEIKELRLKGDTYLAEILEKIKTAVEERKPESLTAIYKDHLKKEKEEKISLLLELIESCETIFAYEGAIQFYRKLIEIEPSAENHFDFGCFLEEFNFYNEAIEQFKAVIQLYKELDRKSLQKYFNTIADVFNRLAVLHSFQNEILLARKNYKEALNIRKLQARKHTKYYQPYVAMILNNLGNLYSHSDFNISKNYNEEALQIRRSLVKEEPLNQQHSNYVAQSLSNLAKLYEQKDDFLLSSKYYNESLEIRKVLAKNNPFFLPGLAKVLNNLSSLHRVENEFLIGKRYSEEALEIRRDLSKKNQRKYLPNIANTLYNLAICNRFLNENSLAFEQYQESLSIYEGIVKEHPQVYEIEYARMLIVGFQFFHRSLENLKEARKILLNYLQIYEAQELLKMINDLEKDKSP